METASGIKYSLVSARALSELPVWKGQRLVDEEHVKTIYESLSGNIRKLSLTPYIVANIIDSDGSENKCIVDGQHRSHVLRMYFRNLHAEDFAVLVGESTVYSEEDSIQLFKDLNRTKSIPWKQDPVLAANAYIEALASAFNTDKKKLCIRPGKTTKPYMSVDKLRDTLISKRVYDWKQTPTEFVEYAKRKNEEALLSLDFKSGELTTTEKRAVDSKFALGLDDKFAWI